LPIRRRLRLAYVLLLIGGLAALVFGGYALGSNRNTELQTYVEGVIGLPERPTPLFARSNPVDRDLASLVFSGLTRIGADGQPHPNLAERWEVSPDGLTYSFRLRDGLTWHDGAKLDSADVLFTVSAVQAPGFQGLPSLTARWAGITLQAPDERTVVFQLPTPSPAFLTLASLGIVPRHLLEGRDAVALADAPLEAATVGAGPFRLTELDEAGALLEPNLQYHAGPPQLQRLELRFYAGEPAIAEALRRGEIDGALLTDRPAPASLDAVAARAELDAVPLTEASYLILYINNQREPFDQPPLRRAIAATVDRAALMPAGSVALPGDGPIVPGSWAHAPGGWNTPAQSDALFIAAGYRRGAGGLLERDGQPLRLELLTNDDAVRTDLAERIAEQLRERGVAITTRTLPAGELLRHHIEPREYDLLLFGWLADADPDPFGGWHTSQIAPGGRNVAGFHDLEADQLLEAARNTLNIDERRDLYRRWQSRFVDLAPSVVLQYSRRLYVQPLALERGDLGVLFEPSSRFHNAHNWRFTDAAR
jgi:peptide/nickel transport system substrate-binding protein